MNWPISWNDVKETIERKVDGYAEHHDVICFPEAEFEFSGAVNMDIPGNPFVDGDIVTVVYDGVEYVRTAKVFPAKNLFSGYYVGNLKFIEGADTGEPFALMSCYDMYGNFMHFMAIDTDNFISLGRDDYSTHRIGCKAATETIHPIDPKFLPGAVLPVVTLSGEVSTETTMFNLTAEESAKMDALLSPNCKVFVGDVSFRVDDTMVVPLVCCYGVSDLGQAVVCSGISVMQNTPLVCMFGKDPSGAWMFTYNGLYPSTS